MKYNIGDRVGAILKGDRATVHLFGYGIYTGERIPHQDLGVRLFGAPMDNENPCIILDSGKEVYGCECWWGPEARIKEITAGKRVIEVDIEEARRVASGK